MKLKHISAYMLFIFLLSSNIVLANEPWIDSDSLVSKTLMISASEQKRLIQLEKEGVVIIRPVALPRGQYLKGNNKVLGWPVGIKIGKTLICVYHQWLTHRGCRYDGSTSSDAVVIRSTDNGQTWSDPIDIRQFGINTEKTVLGFGNSLGVLNNKVYLATTYGIYRSEDEGHTWTFIKDVLTQASMGNQPGDSFGPRMIIHPDKGLVIPAHGNVKDPFIHIYSSQDEGNSWKHEHINLSNPVNLVEPTGFYNDGRLIFLTRNHNQGIVGTGGDDTSHPYMMVSGTGWFPMQKEGITNISSYRWPDTTDLDFNPITNRYEAVVTNRSGGIGENEKNGKHEQTVNLWSISKEDLYAGNADKWRFEATLLRLKSGKEMAGPTDVDAAHPGGAVIDIEQGVQHIFIYCGTFGTPTGIYRITRTLDTEKLAKITRKQSP